MGFLDKARSSLKEAQERAAEQRSIRGAHLCAPPSAGDAMHFHAYGLEDRGDSLELVLKERVSTDADGIAHALGLQAESNVDLVEILDGLERKLSESTRFAPI